MAWLLVICSVNGWAKVWKSVMTACCRLLKQLWVCLVQKLGRLSISTWECYAVADHKWEHKWDWWWEKKYYSTAGDVESIKVFQVDRFYCFTLPPIPPPPPTTPSPHFHPTHPHYHPCFCLVCILTEQDVQFLPVFTYVHTSYWYCNYYYYWVPRSHYWNRLEPLQG